MYRVHCPIGVIAETDNLPDAETFLLDHYYNSGDDFTFDQYHIEHPTKPYRSEP